MNRIGSCRILAAIFLTIGLMANWLMESSQDDLARIIWVTITTSSLIAFGLMLFLAARREWFNLR